MLKKYFSVLILFVILFQFVQAQPVSLTFNASGTYTVPAGYSAILTIEAWGGGGSGGGGTAASNARGGGGGGAYARITGQILASGNYAVTVGAGGVAPAANGAGQNGGASSFTTLVVAAGGTAGANVNGGAGGTVAASTGTTRFAGGTGGNRQNNGGGGGGGGSATPIANGGNGTNGAAGIGGVGGAGTGAGGNGGNTLAVANNGTAPGGGGGGKGALAATSGNGAAGRVVVTVTTVLAIQFNYFNVSKINGINTLNWLASCSSSQAIFEIERSADGRNFTAIHTITATQARCAEPFAYADNNNMPGTVYYRIKSIDVDGVIKYSATIKISDLPKNRRLASVFPNPVNDIAQLNINAAKKDRVELSVTSLEGKLVQRKIVDLQAGVSIISLDVADLQRGVYIVKGVFSDGQSSSIKFLKQ